MESLQARVIRAMAEASNLCDARFVPQTRHGILTDCSPTHVCGQMGHQNNFGMAGRDNILGSKSRLRVWGKILLHVICITI